MKLRGRIDRIDVSDGGDAVVYDYKASRALPAAKWIKEGSLQVALYMRAVEQLLGLQAAGGFYQPLSGEDLRARGVLDRDSDLELDSVRTDVCEHEEVGELLDEAIAAAGAAAAEAGRGALEPRAHTCAFRGGCKYPTICRSER
jgi:RecB family exonuclease